MVAVASRQLSVDIAPGVNIYSSVFDEETGVLGWAMFQGTSMATPHVAGAAALLLDQNPNLTPADVKSLLGNNAERNVWADFVDGTLAGLMDRGGGRIDLARASAATVTFDPMSLSFGISNGNRPVNESISVTVRNLSATAKELSISGGTEAMTFPSTVTVPRWNGHVHRQPGDSRVRRGGRRPDDQRRYDDVPGSVLVLERELTPDSHFDAPAGSEPAGAFAISRRAR